MTSQEIYESSYQSVSTFDLLHMLTCFKSADADQETALVTILRGRFSRMDEILSANTGIAVATNQ